MTMILMRMQINDGSCKLLLVVLPRQRLRGFGHWAGRPELQTHGCRGIGPAMQTAVKDDRISKTPCSPRHYGMMHLKVLLSAKNYFGVYSYWVLVLKARGSNFELKLGLEVQAMLP